MSDDIELYQCNQNSLPEVARLLSAIDCDVVPSISSRMAVDEYAIKLLKHAVCYGARRNGRTIGFVAAYCNDMKERMAFLSIVGVLPEVRGCGVAGLLLGRIFKIATAASMITLKLETHKANRIAISFFDGKGFRATSDMSGVSGGIVMVKSLHTEAQP